MKFEEVTKYTLYSSLTKELCNEYSLFKLGQTTAVTRFSEEIASCIRKKIPNLSEANIAIFQAGKYPLTETYKKNSFLLAENVAKLLRVPFIAGEYKYSYTKNSFYDGRPKRNINHVHIPFIKNKKELKKKKYHVIMIDDSIVSGISLTACLYDLSKITDNVSFFSVIKIDSKKYLEAHLNDYALEKSTNVLLSKIVMKKGYVFTSHMLRTIDNLSKVQQKEFLSKIGAQQKKLFKKAYQVYFGKPFAL